MDDPHRQSQWVPAFILILGFAVVAAGFIYWAHERAAATAAETAERENAEALTTLTREIKLLVKMKAFRDIVQESRDLKTQLAELDRQIAEQEGKIARLRKDR